MARSRSLLLVLLLPLLPLLPVVAGCADRSPKPTPSAASPPVATPTPTSPVTKIERASRDGTARESSSVVLGKVDDATHVFLADEDDAAIIDVAVDTLTQSNTIVASTSIGTRPRDLLLLADGRLAATLPEQAVVAIFSREARGNLREVARIKTPDEPVALALSPDDHTLYVTTGASHSLLAYAIDDSALFKERSRHVLGREPRAVLATADSVFVTHATEAFTSILSLGSDKITTRNIDNRTQCGGRQCQGARTARGAQAIVRIGERGIVVPAAQALPNPPHGFTKGYLCRPIDRDNADVRARRAAIERTGVTGYGIGSGETGPPIIADLEVIDAKDGSFYGVGSLPLTASVHDHACLLPRAAVALGRDSKDGLMVACLGSSILMRSRGTDRFDLGAIATKQGEYMGEGIHANVTTDYVNVPAGPSGLAIDDERSMAFVWSVFARKLSTIDLSAIGSASKKDKDNLRDALTSSLEIPRTVPKDEAWLAGRTLFYKNHDRRISADGRACANCHIDGRDDGLTWRTPMGPRRTRMLAGQTTAGPFGWRGDNATLEAHIKSTIHNLEGAGLPSDDLTKLALFVTSIPQPPKAQVNDLIANKGKAIFQSAECASCHTTGASDRSVHDVGTGGAYLTPTLAGVATRDQLMHDGRYKNLDALLTGATSMGRGSQLSPDDRQALIKYLETL